MDAALTHAPRHPPTTGPRPRRRRTSALRGACIHTTQLAGRRTLTITRKGGKVVTIPLAPRMNNGVIEDGQIKRA